MSHFNRNGLTNGTMNTTKFLSSIENRANQTYNKPCRISEPSWGPPNIPSSMNKYPCGSGSTLNLTKLHNTRHELPVFLVVLLTCKPFLLLVLSYFQHLFLLGGSSLFLKFL